MKRKLQRLLNQLFPFIIFGVALIAVCFGLMLILYLFLFGAIAGTTLYLYNWIKRQFMPPRKPQQSPKKRGRIIDSDDYRELK